MTISPSDLDHLTSIALTAAAEAATHIRSAQLATADIHDKPTGGSTPASTIVTEVDRAADTILRRHLEPASLPHGFAVLTEETEDDRARLEAPAFWCADPLDGTLAFVKGQPGYSVSIALVGRDGTPLLGVVHDPVEDSVYHAIHRQGAFQNHTPWRLPEPPENSPLHFYTDHSFQSWNRREAILQQLDTIAETLGCEGLQQHSWGGAVMNTIHALSTPPACYFKLPKPEDGGGSLWDFAATACIYHELGAIATDASGAQLDLNRHDSTFMNHRGVLYTTHPDIAHQITGL